MENINAVRRAANRLREKIDPRFQQMTASEVLIRTLADQELTVDEVAADDDVLAGGLGVLKRKYQTIFVSKALPTDEKAEVIAHEIAHFVIHLENEVRIERAYAAPGAGDPVQRVEAYSKRERREAQANTFARELLLPRRLARRLFQEGLRAAEIATALGLKLETVYQQLADSLLLPEPAEPKQKVARAPQELDESQHTAAMHIGSPFLLEAGPGTGKTNTMVERIVWLLGEKHSTADEVLALTFSNKAAEEIADRVERAVGPEAVNIWTGTFHAFGLELLRKHHERFNLPPDPRLIDTSEAINLLEDALPALPIVHMQNLFEPALALRDILRTISRAKDELVGPDDYYELAEEMMRVTDRNDSAAWKAAEKCKEVALVYRHYQRILESIQAVDYGDLIRLPAVKMQSDPSFQALLAAKFKWVHVDEYQDINRASAMMVKGVVGEGERLWVVGDARQSIYRFRGASSRNMARFTRDYPQGIRGQLKVNYRSTEPIVSTFKSFGARMLVSAYALPLDLRAYRGEAPSRPSTSIGADPAGEIDLLAGNIRELEREGVPLRDQAVIARTNGALATLGSELEARGIPVLYIGPLFDRPEVRDLLSLLSLIVHDGSSVFRVGGFPEYGLRAPELARVIQEATSREITVRELLDRQIEVTGLDQKSLRSLAILSSQIAGYGPGSTPWFVLMDYLFNRSDYVATVLSGQMPSDDVRRAAVRQLIEALRTMPLRGSKAPIVRGLERIRHLVLLSDDRELRRLPDEMQDIDGVNLMTIHASKGLEFDAVHLPQLTRRAIPAANRPDACPPVAGMIAENVEVDAHEAEEECLFFVALSRAKSYLKLYRPSMSGGKNSNPSKFLDRLPISTAHGPAPLRRIFPQSGLEPISDMDVPATLTAADIEAFERCPRRFFYDRVAGLGGSMARSAYLQAHGCILAVVDAARAADAPLTSDEMRQIFERAWNETKLPGHPFEKPYRDLVERMLGNLTPTLLSAAKAKSFVVSVRGRDINVAADFVRGPAESPTLTVVRSGKRSSSEADRISYSLLLEGAQMEYGARFRLETFHVIDGTAGPVDQTPVKKGNRVTAAKDAVKAMEDGLYPAIRSDFQCPRCKHFFICPAPQKS
ncbi:MULTISPECIES: UvrD-helicase domain-containing protein [unclassified Ensifer]|uniref:UvrD-helicase domain-containing protein n=1 Tax=unclassified Ensifer TaxID=2633371 RepID=UPI00071412F6|nr:MULTISPECIES: UvrD-helicase domain-containing protein [unclassified Ensifer]KQX43210.1 hypothetical protein ASD49_11155 [Ensifer sp. Root1298]KQX72759.1 hypothetical protein ASD41_11655 [Ensifer sp. Root1312]KRC15725.1 hypothetical protein ASE29_11210 [Ensifer sp. Root74]KRD59000.1 hypothetical protein ASE71_09285 [Ensifer sp. Root954]